MTDEFETKYLPLTLSIETLGGLSTPLVRRGTPLPAKRMQTFSTAIDNQKAVSIVMYFGESPIVANNIRIGEIELSDIPDAPRGTPQIELIFEVNTKCKIKVTATEKESRKVILSEVDEAPIHLTKERIQELLSKANESRNEDEILVQQIEEFLAYLGLALNEDNLSAIMDRSKRLEQLIPVNMFTLGNVFSDDLFTAAFGGFGSRKRPNDQTEPNPPRKTETAGTTANKKTPQSEDS